MRNVYALLCNDEVLSLAFGAEAVWAILLSVVFLTAVSRTPGIDAHIFQRRWSHDAWRHPENLQSIVARGFSFILPPGTRAPCFARGNSCFIAI